MKRFKSPRQVQRVSLYPRSDRQRFLPPPQPRRRHQISHRSQPRIRHLGRDHRRGNGGLMALLDDRHRAPPRLRQSIHEKLTVPRLHRLAQPPVRRPDPGLYRSESTSRDVRCFVALPFNRPLMGGRSVQRDVTAPETLRYLTRYASRLWPVLRDVRWTHGWSGRLAYTSDHYPHIHEPDDGYWSASATTGVAMSSAMGPQLARRTLGGRAADIDMPITSIEQIPFHALWRSGVAARVHVWAHPGPARSVVLASTACRRHCEHNGNHD